MNFFQIRQPAPTSFIIRMGNIIPGYRPFSTNLTYLCHYVLLTLLLSPLSLDQQAITTKHINYSSYVHNYRHFKNRFLYPLSFLIATSFLHYDCQKIICTANFTINDEKKCASLTRGKRCFPYPLLKDSDKVSASRTNRSQS